MKRQFLNFIEELMNANPELTEKLMNDDIKAYLDILNDSKDEKPILTDNGKLILKYLQEHQEIKTWKSRDLAQELGVSSRSTSGAFRKLVNDGFCERLSAEPVIYSLTEKGKKFIIEEN